VTVRAALPQIWTVGHVLQWTQRHFADKGIESARLDAEVLLAATLGVDRVYLYTHYDQPLSQAERDAYRKWVLRRSRREPVAYILGNREFYGRRFAVSPAVLVPRPETEHVVEAALHWARDCGPGAPRILDVGTGSGAIGVTLACELERAWVVATDIDANALAMARLNAQSHGVADRLETICGDLLEPVRQANMEPFDIIVANPPYVDPKQRAELPPEVRDHEPASALFADASGLEIVRRLAAQVPPVLALPSLFACEIGSEQQADAEAAVCDALPSARVATLPDLAGHGRVVTARLTASGRAGA
jgi:release factor glutamine methyltransferase